MVTHVLLLLIAANEPRVLGFDPNEKAFVWWDGEHLRATPVDPEDERSKYEVNRQERRKVKDPDEVAAEFDPGIELYKAGTKTSAKFEGGEVKLDTSAPYPSFVVKSDEMVRWLPAAPFGKDYNLSGIRRSKRGALAILYKRTKASDERVLDAVAMSWAGNDSIASVRALALNNEGKWEATQGWSHDGSEKQSRQLKLQVVFAKLLTEPVKATLEVKILGTRLADGKDFTILTKKFPIKRLQAGGNVFELPVTWDPKVSPCGFRVEARMTGDFERDASLDDLVTCGT